MDANLTVQVFLCFSIDSGWKTASNVYLIFVLVVSFIGNTSICLLVARHYQLHTVTNGYIVNMSVIHLCFAAFCNPFLLRLRDLHSESKLRTVLSSLHSFTFVFFTALSSFSISLITLDRYHVMQTLGRSKVSGKTAKKTVVASWTVSLILATVWIILNEYQVCKHFIVCSPLILSSCRQTSLKTINAVYITLLFFLPSSFTLLAFTRIWKRLWSGSSYVRPLGGGHWRSIYFAAERRTTQTMFIVLLLFHVCWGPYFVVSCDNIFDQTKRPQHFYDIIVCLAFGNCCVCPLVYSVRNPRVSLILARKRRPHNSLHLLESVSSETGKARAYYISWARERTNASIFDKSDATATTSGS